MKFELKNCKDGSKAEYKTELEIYDDGSLLTFIFNAENSQLFCCASGYNKIHSMGDVCELLIGTDPERKVYYEIEISPIGELMIAKMENHGLNGNERPNLTINFESTPFVSASCEKTDNGYRATLKFDKERINTGVGEIYFNAYRIETDGGVPEKHLFALSPTMKAYFHAPEKFVYLKDVLKKT